MRVTSKGQVTIPIEVREKLGSPAPHGGRFRSTRRHRPAGEGPRQARARQRRRRSRTPEGNGDRQDEHRRNPGADPQARMKATLVDSNVLLDIATADPKWFSWSSETLETVADNRRWRSTP